jgi:hypothetical protein
MTPEIYRDYLIEPIFVYTNGKADFNVYPESGKECGWIEPSTTIERIKDSIDEKLSEQ